MKPTKTKIIIIVAIILIALIAFSLNRSMKRDGISIHINNKAETIQLPYEVYLRTSNDIPLIHGDKIDSGNQRLKGEKPQDTGEGALLMSINGVEFYLIGYLDYSIYDVYVEITIEKYNAQTGVVNLVINADDGLAKGTDTLELVLK